MVREGADAGAREAARGPAAPRGGARPASAVGPGGAGNRALTTALTPGLTSGLTAGVGAPGPGAVPAVAVAAVAGAAGNTAAAGLAAPGRQEPPLTLPDGRTVPSGTEAQRLLVHGLVVDGGLAAAERLVDDVRRHARSLRDEADAAEVFADQVARYGAPPAGVPWSPQMVEEAQQELVRLDEAEAGL
ncbi:hypothetical protein [Thalassiella azotivora]